MKMNCCVDYDESLIAKDSYIEMKCISCGHEEKMPSFIYGEEADYLLDIGYLWRRSRLFTRYRR